MDLSSIETSETVRYLSDPGRLRAVWVEGRSVAQTVLARHGLDGAAAKMMTESLLAAALLAPMHEEGEEINLRWEAPQARILVDVRPEGKIRGYFRLVESDRLNGILSVLYTRNSSHEPPYQGMVEMPTGEMDRDLQYYFEQSEQITTVVAIQVEIVGRELKFARGALVQALGGASAAELEIVRRLKVADLRKALHKDRSYFPQALNQILPSLFFKPVDTNRLETFCTCSFERVSEAMVAARPDESGTGGLLEVVCDFCGKKYVLGGT